MLTRETESRAQHNQCWMHHSVMSTQSEESSHKINNPKSQEQHTHARGPNVLESLD